jgi:hypothetical protein
VNHTEDRVAVLAALSCVDHVIVFDEDTPAALIEAIRPDLYVKGGDYHPDTVPEAPLVHPARRRGADAGLPAGPLHLSGHRTDPVPRTRIPTVHHRHLRLSSGTG